MELRVHSRRDIVRSVSIAMLAMTTGAASKGSVIAETDKTRFQIGDAFVVATDSLNLRAGAGLDEEVLTVLHRGAAGNVRSEPARADGYNWYKVDVGQIGWVVGKYLDHYDGQQGGVRLRVVDGPLNLRDYPSTSGGIITTIPTGGTMVVRQADGGTWADGYHWVAVQLESQGGEQGFIADAFTERIW